MSSIHDDVNHHNYDEAHTRLLLRIKVLAPDLPGQEPALWEKALTSFADACTVEAILLSRHDDARAKANGNGAAHSEPQTSALETYTAAELENEEFPEIRWAVQGLLPEGLTFLVGSPKIGKSWLALDIALAVACGGKALGSIDVEQGPVLYCALEDNKRRMKKRIGALLGEREHFPPLLQITHFSPRIGDGLETAILAWLAQHPEARLVIIDTLARVRRRRGRNADSYQDDSDTIAVIQTIATEHNIAILVVHHDRKAEADDVLATISGTFGLSGSADGAMVLKRSRGTADATIFVTGRDIENEQEIALRFINGAWLYMGSAEEYAITKERQDILSLLQNGDALAPKEIAEALGKNGSAIRRLLSKMTEDGQVKVNDAGKYFRSIIQKG